MLRIFEHWDQSLSGKLHFAQELQDLQEEARLLRTEAVEREKDVIYKDKAGMHLKVLKEFASYKPPFILCYQELLLSYTGHITTFRLNYFSAP